MNILAIETSCDETAAAVVADGRTVLSSVVASQVEAHALYGGVVPEIASRCHTETISALTAQALAQAPGLPGMEAIDAVAVTATPGLVGALLAGVSFAKGLSLRFGKPLVPVHHLRAHIAAAYLSDQSLAPPFLALVVSGGHTHLMAVQDYTDFKVLGRTRDDAAGEAFDKAARQLGLPYPGGVHLDRLSAAGNRDAYRFPDPKVDGLDFSFSGLKTAVINLLHRAAQKGESLPAADVAASFQAAVTGILCRKTAHAAAVSGLQTVVLAGGVAANSALRRQMEQTARRQGLRLVLPPVSLCGDNAAMVGAQGYYEWCAGHTSDLSLNANPYSEP